MPRIPPVPFFWGQLVLRSTALLISLSTIIIAIYVSVSHIHRTYYLVFISAVWALTIDVAEITSFVSHYSVIRVPRLHPLLLIFLDFAVICLLVWSFFSLFLDALYSGQISSAPAGNPEPFNTIETWFTIVIGAAHGVLLVCDYIEFCARRKATRSFTNDVILRRDSPSRGPEPVCDRDAPSRGPSRDPEPVGDMDWG